MQALNEKIIVSPQINAEDISNFKGLGIEQIICNRPDNEEEGQPSFEAIQASAKKSGINCIYAPVTPGDSPEGILPIVKDALNSDKKTLMYCKTGTRAVIVWALLESEKGTKSVDEIINEAAKLGYGIGQLSGFIQEYADRQK